MRRETRELARAVFCSRWWLAVSRVLREPNVPRPAARTGDWMPAHTRTSLSRPVQGPATKPRRGAKGTLRSWPTSGVESRTSRGLGRHTQEKAPPAARIRSGRSAGRGAGGRKAWPRSTQSASHRLQVPVSTNDLVGASSKPTGTPVLHGVKKKPY